MPPRWVNNPFAPPVTPLDFSKRLETGKQSSQGSNDVINPNLTFPSPTFKIERLGTVAATIAVNAFSSPATSVALSPALPDATLANYIISATVSSNDAAQAFAGHGFISSTVLFTVRAFRIGNPASALASTGVTVAGNKLTDVSGMALTPIPNPTTVSDAHGQNFLFDHAHDTVGHPVTDPQHTHTVSANTGAVTVNVDWVIFHK